MTSMPASRRALRDDLGAAIVTVESRLRDHYSVSSPARRQNTAVRLTVIGSSPAWPNPGSAHSGYLLEGPERLPPRLRARRPRPTARVRVVAGRRRDRDHALPPRPLGRPRAVGVGQLLPVVERPGAAPGALGATGRRRVPHRSRRAARLPGHVRARVQAGRVRTQRAVHDGRAVRDPGARPALHASRRTRSGSRTRPACSPTRATPRRARSSSTAARDADLFVCEATLLRGELDGEPRGHLSLDEAVAAFEESGARGCSSRTARASCRHPDGFELAYDGLELEV